MGRCLPEGSGKDSFRYEKGPIACDRDLFQGSMEVDAYHDQSAPLMVILKAVAAFTGYKNLPPYIFCSRCDCICMFLVAAGLLMRFAPA